MADQQLLAQLVEQMQALTLQVGDLATRQREGQQQQVQDQQNMVRLAEQFTVFQHALQGLQGE